MNKDQFAMLTPRNAVVVLFLEIFIFVSVHSQDIVPTRRSLIGHVVFDDNDASAPNPSDAESCQTNDNLPGHCLSLNDCGLTQQQLFRNPPKVCYWERSQPVICCRRSVTVESTVPNESTQQFECGRRNVRVKRQRDRNPYIAGGEVAPLGAWPWMVSIHTRNLGFENFLCGGSVISKSYVLTAAHCFGRNGGKVPNLARYIVRVGSNINSNGTVHTVQDITVHSDYRTNKHYNDIALIQLNNEIEFGRWVQPICLPSSDLATATFMGTDVTVIGWGDQSFGGRRTPELRQVTVNVVSRATCNSSYSRLRTTAVSNGITAQFICAGVPQGGKDACQADSGGPLMRTTNNRWSVIGVVSFGYGCALRDFPGVYTKVTSYLNWIRENTDL